jgi:hypothetical protein
VTYPTYEFPFLPTTTVIPSNDDLFIPYQNRVYEELAQAINERDNSYFPWPITSSATNFPNVPNFGAFLVCISGVDSTLPTLTASLCKADATASGSISVLGFQVGTGAWSGNALTITSTATNFQVAHNRTGVSGNFNIRVIGTQG